MILSETIDHIQESFDFSNITPCKGNPFEFILNMVYESTLMEQRINLQAICLEYSYLKNTGVEPINESNIITNIFSAIKNAIATVFRKICEFFKGLFSSVDKKIADSKKEATNIKNQVATTLDSDIIDLSDYEFKKMDNSMLSEIEKSIRGCSPIDYIKPMISKFQDYIYDLADGGSAKGAGDEDISAAISEYKQYVQNIIDKYDASESIDNISEEDILKQFQPVKYGKISFKKLSNEIADYILECMSVKDNIKKIFDASKNELTKYKKTVEEAEKRAYSIIHRLKDGTSKEKKILNGVVNIEASAINKLINTADTCIIKANHLAAKCLAVQLNQCDKLIDAAKQQKRNK